MNNFGKIIKEWAISSCNTMKEFLIREIKSDVTFITMIMIYVNIMSQNPKDVDSNMVEIGFVCFVIFTLMALGGAFCDSELGQIILSNI